MNGSNLFTVLISSIKSRFAAIMSKVKLWTSWNFIKSQFTTKVRQFFVKLLDIKPKNKDDYYTVFGWMISKKLAYSAVIIMGVLSIWYITSVRGSFKALGSDGTSLRTYKYNSIQLRMAKDKVRILGKSGYLAYEGDVKKGYTEGLGTLYAKDGHTVYVGNFSKNKFEGEGKSFYDNEALCYEGTFHDNLYDGTGKLYRDNGTILYDGEFSRGKKNGEGKLSGENGKVVFDGIFSNDELVYSIFLNKSTSEAGNIYTGTRRVWYSDEDYCVLMSDINALYFGQTDSEGLANEVMIKGIYVLENHFSAGQVRVTSIPQLSGIYGNPIYEGNSDVLLSEAVIINYLNETKPLFNGPVTMKTTSPYSDVTMITSFDEEYSVYLTAYQIGDLVYTFYSKDKNGDFAFYSIKTTSEES